MTTPAFVEKRGKTVLGQKEELFSHQQLDEIADDVFNSLAMWGLTDGAALYVVNKINDKIKAMIINQAVQNTAKGKLQ